MNDWWRNDPPADNAQNWWEDDPVDEQERTPPRRPGTPAPLQGFGSALSEPAPAPEPRAPEASTSAPAASVRPSVRPRQPDAPPVPVAEDPRPRDTAFRYNLDRRETAPTQRDESVSDGPVLSRDLLTNPALRNDDQPQGLGGFLSADERDEPLDRPYALDPVAEMRSYEPAQARPVQRPEGLGGAEGVEPEVDTTPEARGDRRDRREPAVGVAGDPPEDRPRQPISDLGRRAAMGLAEPFASVPEFAALLGDDIVRDRYGSALDAVPALQQERDGLLGILDTVPEDDPRHGAATMRLTNVEGELTRAYRMVEQDIANLEDLPDATARPLFQVGQRMRDAVADFVGETDPRFDDRLMSQLSYGFGNMTGMIATSLLGGPVLGTAGVTTQGMAMNSSQIYQEALQSGASEDEARLSARWAGLIGSAEVLPLQRALNVLPPRMQAAVTTRVSRHITDILQSGAEEAAQESLINQLGNNILASQIYDPDRGWTEGLTEAAIVGGILGTGTGAIGTTLNRPGGGADPAVMGGEPPTPTDEPPEGPTAPAPAPPVADTDPQRLNSPRLTEEDRASPIPNDIIDDGLATLEAIERGEPLPPAAPQADAAPDVATDTPPAPLPQTPTPPQGLGAAVLPPAPEGRRLSEPMPEVDENGPTGRTVRIDLDTGEPVVVPAQETSEATAPTSEQPESDEATTPAPAPQDEVAAPTTEAPSRPLEAPSEGQAAPQGVSTPAPQASESAPRTDSAGRRAGSWVILDRETGEAVTEVQGQDAADRVNLARYEPVPAGDYLGQINARIRANGGTNEGLDLAQVRREIAQAAAERRTGGAAAPAGVSVGPSQAPTASAPERSIARRTISQDTAVTPAGREVAVEYAVVEADDLVTSNTETGQVNPAYPAELQPRDRTRGTSSEQVRTIANNLNPRLLAENASTTDGAPIVSSAGVVESGNGRTMAVAQAYRDGRADEYRRFLEDRGYDIRSYQKPVLVRIRQTDMQPEELQAFTRESNTRTTAAMSSTEQAMSDAQAMPDTMLSLYRGGDIDSAGNRDFVRAFIGNVVSEADRGQMIDSSGAMSQDAVRRVQGALLARAYNDADLIGALIEASDSNMKSIGGALMDVAAEWAQMRAEARSGQIDSDVDQTTALLEAVRVVNRARRERRNVAEFVGQGDLLSGDSVSPEAAAFLRLMFRNADQWTQPTGRDRLAGALRFYVDEARKTAPGADMFGARTDPGDILNTARDRQYGESEQQDSLFGQRSGDPGPDAGTRSGDGQAAQPERQDQPATDGGRPAAEAQSTEPDQVGQEPDASPVDDLGNPVPNVSTRQSGVTTEQARAQVKARRALDTLSTAERARLDDINKRLADKLRNQTNAGLDPEMVSLAVESATLYVKAGIRRFREYAQALAEATGLPMSSLGRYARIAYNDVRDEMEANGEGVADMDDSRAVIAELARLNREERDNAPGTGSDLEQDLGSTAPSDGLGAADVPAAAGNDVDGIGARGSAADGRGGAGRGGRGVSEGNAPGVGSGRDRTGRGAERAEPGAAADQDGTGSRDRGERRLPDDASPDQATARNATDGTDRGDRASQQARADRVKVKPADEANVRETLPLLLPEQQDDVLKVERRFAEPDGFGMLLTNGTGTGKTYSGGGVIKRFAQQGKDNILIVAPSQGILDAWVGMGSDMGLTINRLSDTQSAGSGIVATTYANLGANNAVAGRNWDLIVTDEAHSLSSAKDGSPTSALDAMRAISNRPEDIWRRARMIHADEWAAWKAMPEGDAKDAALAKVREKTDATKAEFESKERSRVLFLSATPFAYDKNVDYAEGYLFAYPGDGTTDSGSNQSGANLFMVENFGYRIRYHRLTQPEAAVDRGVFEREFHEKLKSQGALSGRSLDIDTDYDRRFVAVDSQIGQRIDEALKYLSDQRDADGSQWQAVRQQVNRQFDYLKRMQLLEAIKAEKAIPDIRRHVEMGRKVVVFHDYNVGGGRAPFALAISEDQPGYAEYQKMLADLPWLADLDFSSMLPPKDAITQAFGERARVYNGTITKRERAANLAAFNEDGGPIDVLVIQSAAGQAGISAHDTTGGSQRVLINLGMPVRPVTTLQEEGRIRRVGTVSDALFRYYTIGTAWERQAFATKIATNSGTVENLALGNEARAIRESFIEAYTEADRYEPGMDGEGKGGKERDRQVALTSPFDQAKTHYFGRMKNTRSRQNRQGTDFYATPEPLGLTMVQWAAPRQYEKVLEPSAGDGAIARYFPDDSDRTIIEPSFDLSSKAQLRANGARAVTQQFETYHINNKHDVVVMNPPFGMGGKTAYEHVAKAMRHTRPGGRVVAIVPTGPAADKRLGSLFDPGNVKEGEWHLTATVDLPAVTFERAGTGVRTRVLILDRTMGPADAPTQRINMTGADDIGTFFDRLEGIAVPDRPAQIVEPGAIAEMSEAADEANLTETVNLTEESGDFDVSQFTHTQSGADVFIAQAQERTSRDVYQMTMAVARKHGGWWNRFNKPSAGAHRGFAFASVEDRQAFLDEMNAPAQIKEQRNLTSRDDDHATEAMFYSPLLRAVQGAKQQKAPARDWVAILKKMPGVKQIEMEWLGVYDWLDSQEGTQVPRAALERFIRDGQIELVEERLAGDEASYSLAVEVDYNNAMDPDWEFEAELYLDEAREELEDRLDDDGEPEPFDDADVQDRAEELARQRWEPTEFAADVFEDRSGEYVATGVWDTDMAEYRFPDLNATGKDEDIIEAAEEYLRARDSDTESDGVSQFSEYTEDGGTDYREVLLRVPNLHRTGRNRPPSTDVVDMYREAQRRGVSFTEYSDQATNPRNRRRPFAQSAHFEQENIVVHARVKDRTGPNGERVMFIEEIQSDLATKWRENNEPAEVTARRRELEAETRVDAAMVQEAAEAIEDTYVERINNTATLALIADDLRNGILNADVRGLSQGQIKPSQWEARSLLREVDGEMYDRLVDLVRRSGLAETELLNLGTERSMDPSTPDTPFKEEHTYALMVKRLLREAAEKGYDRVAWTPGYMQAERWNNAAQSVVEGVEWAAPDQSALDAAMQGSGTDLSGHRYVDLEMSEGRTVQVTVDDQGVIDSAAPGPLAGKQLSQAVGPSLARQIMTEPSGTVSGQKITFPDSGYAIAYDQQIKRSVDKLAKGTGTRVEQARDLPDMDTMTATDRQRMMTGRSRAEIVSALRDAGVDTGRLFNREKVQQQIKILSSWDRNAGEDEAYQSITTRETTNDEFRRAFGGEGGRPVWSITITPELREKALAPQPILQKPAFDTDQATLMDEAVAREILPEMRKRLDAQGLSRVGLGLDFTSDRQGATLINPRLGKLDILIGTASADPVNTLYHESVHALHAMDLFHGKEWNRLVKAARGEGDAEGWIAKYRIQERYPDLTEAEQVEEAIAEAYGEWAADQDRAGLPGPLRLTMQKIQRFLRALADALTGRGFFTAEDVFGRALAGEVGRRHAGNTGSRRIEQGKEFFGAEPAVIDRSKVDQRLFPQWRDQVMALFRGQTLPTEMTLSAVPVVLQKLGGQGRRLIIPTGKAKRVSDKHTDLTPQAWLNLPSLIADPEIVVRQGGADRSGDLLVVTRQQVEDGRYVVAAIKSAGTDTRNRSATVVLSFYPKDRLDQTIRSAAANNGIAYVRANRAEVGYEIIRANSGRPTPAGDAVSLLRGDENILTYDDVFKDGDGDSPPTDVITREQRPAHAVRPLSASGRQRVAQATQTAHVPDRRVFDELVQRNVSLLDRSRGAKGAMLDRVDRTRIALQDRMLPLRRVEERLEETAGATIAKDRSAYEAEMRYTGRVGHRLDMIDQDYTKPIVGLVVDMGRGADPLRLTSKDGDVREGAEAAGLWLSARHAKERNKRIAQINPNLPDGGAGMTNAQADAILAEAAGSSHAAKLDRLGEITDQLGRDMIDWREEAGLLSTDEAQTWRSMYQHYVPLRGFAESDMHDAVVNEFYGVNRRYNARGPEAMRAMGRTSEAYSPLATLLSMAQEVTVRAEKNTVGKAVVKLAEDFPHPAMWEVVKPEQQRVFNKATGMVETRVVDPTARTLAPDEMAVKRDGEEVRLRLKDPRLSNALGQLGSQEMPNFVKPFSMFARYFSAVNTMLSPPFVIVNAIRDMMTAQVVLGSQAPKGTQAAIRGAVLRDWGKAFRGAYRGMGDGAADTEWSQYFREFSASGGKVSFWKIDAPELQMTDLDNRVWLETGGLMRRGVKKVSRLNTRDNPALNWIERVNLAVDNAARLSAFVEARRQGLAVEEAASLSKNLTVNFNRRGEAGPIMNAFFPFANAAIQGSHVIVKAAKTRQVQGIIGAQIGIGLALDLLNASLSAEDDDGELEYDQLPNWMLRRSLIIPTGGDEQFATVPLPYGFNAFFFLGNRIGKAMRGVISPQEAVPEVMATFFGAFSPISGENIQTTLMPTVIDHINELGQNRDWLGRAIRPEPAFADYGPQSYREWNASAPARFVSQSLNQFTGGNSLEPGAIDISPEYLDHTFGFLTGGAGRFTQRVWNLGEKAAEGNLASVEAYEIPLLRVLRTESGDFLNRGRYFEFRQVVEEARWQVRTAPDREDEPSEETQRAARVYNTLRDTERRRRDLQGRLDTIYANPNLSASQRREQIQQVRDRMNESVFIRFNSAFIEAMGPQAE